MVYHHHHRSVRHPWTFLWLLSIPVYFSILFLVYFLFYWTASAARWREPELWQATARQDAPWLPNLNNSSGGLNVHVWVNLCGTHVHQLRHTPLFPRFPNKRLYITDFRSKSTALQYGQRIFGFLKPALSGYYQFAISSDDTSELWLSFSQNPVEVRLIASVSSLYSSGWTAYGDFRKYPSQISRRLRLQSNTSYYVEVFHKQGVGDGHVVVYWKPPISRSFEVIPSVYLSPFNRNGSSLDQSTPSQTKRDIYHETFPNIYSKPCSDIGGILPRCSYVPSFIVNRTLKRYEGIYLIRESAIFPDDNTTFESGHASFPEWMKGNALVDEAKARYVVSKFMEPLEERYPKKYSLQRVLRIEQAADEDKGDRFLVELQLSLRDYSTVPMCLSSTYVFLKKGSNELCFPEGYEWSRSVNIYFILPVKNQGGWVLYFLKEMAQLYKATQDENFFVIIIDFESDDVDVAGMIKASAISQKITLISKSGPFHKTLAIQEAASRVPSPDDIVFLFDLHIIVPFNLVNSVRKHTIQGKMAYSPAVGRLECGSFPGDPPLGYWEVNGFGIMAVYKSDWDRFGGMNVRDFTTKWGGEDWDLVDRILMAQLEILQLKQPGLLHYFHTHDGMWNNSNTD